MRVPETWVVSWQAYERYLAGDEQIEQVIAEEVRHLLAMDKQYAVRSSANLEDSIDTSFAGQFQSILNVRGGPEILSAIKHVWSQANSPGVMNYLAEKGGSGEAIKMGVILQEMVDPVVSGVAFSKNPITGNYEIIVEAVQGSGEQLVQTGVTPYRWVQKWGTYLQQPEPHPTITASLIDDVITKTKLLAKKAGHPIDLEWVWDGRHLYFVQMREITTLNIPIYSNRISKEFFPGLIKPLVSSTNIPLVDSAWIDLFTEMIGPNDLDPMDLAGIFYHRAYFNMGAMGDIFEILGIPRETLELLQGFEIEGPEKPSFKPSLKTISLLPRIVGFFFQKRKFRRQAVAGIQMAETAYRQFDALELHSLTLPELQEKVKALYDAVQRGAYFNITIPLLASLFDRAFRSRLKRLEIDPNIIDMYADMPEMDALDPMLQLRDLTNLLHQKGTETIEVLAEHKFKAVTQMMIASELREGILEFLEKFGHFGDSGNDFAQPAWRDRPELVVNMILNLKGDAAEPEHSKQLFTSAQVPFFQRFSLNFMYRQARAYQYLRTYVSSVYTLGYGLFRKFYLEIGSRCVERGWLRSPEDIFFLSAEEVQQIAAAEQPIANMLEEIENRKADLDTDRDKLVPELIYGDQPVQLVSVGGEKFKGIATSHGTYSGVARVLMGVEDIDKMTPGDVLVIPYSDVGWSPLFSKAGAVVAESGGILSHSSIIAREYKIPAVVSVAHACQLLDGKMVTVNGYTGEVMIHPEEA
ncbi:MAG: PEP/pyruvate-binding domain-containing protein [Anaerolineae bacterium]|jgi:pyruvate,water dikinase|nr:PEP/pyruvate-binding domain-containing protein [Anaerolineae bacterium]